MPSSDIKALRSWKNFVLDFRREFETTNRCPGSVDSLSLLLLSLAVKQSPVRSSSQASATYEAERLHAATRRCMPKNLEFELTNCTAGNSSHFESILNALDRYSFVNHPFAFGYTYQFWRDSERKIAQVELQSAAKSIDTKNLIAFTQIYTPEWVVEFILANTVLPLVSNSNRSRLALSKWLIPGASGDGQFKTVSSLSILDPAAGAGNFLVTAFDTLMELHTLEGRTPAESIAKIFESQLHGCDIDNLALSVCALNLVAKALRYEPDSLPPVLKGLALATPHEDAILGSLSKNFPGTHPLSKQHDAVVTNPPYIGRKLISRELKTLLKSQYPKSHHDLSAAFFERSLGLLKPGGRTGLITQASILFLPSHKLMREVILDEYSLMSVVDAGPGVFPLQSGEKVNSAVLIVEKPDAGSLDQKHDSWFFNIKDKHDKEFELSQQLSGVNSPERGTESSPISLNPSTFRQFHGSAFSYFIPSAITELLTRATPLESIADIRQGLATTDNNRFVKFVWQVPEDELGSRWFPYAKGAGGQRFQSPIRHVVNWQNDGAEIKTEVARRYPYLKGNTAWVVKNEAFYFKEGLCFSFVNTRGIAVRRLPANCIFDVGASAIFSDENDFLLAYLNSSLMVALANSLNPTINYQVGDLKRLPIFDFAVETKQKLAELANLCANSKEELSALLDPTSWFRSPRHANAPLGHSIYSRVDETDLAGAQNEFIRKVNELKLHISESEEEIDNIVLSEVSTAERWDEATMQKVIDWTRSFQSNRSSDQPTELPDSVELADRFIDNLIVKAHLESLSNERRLPIALQQAIEKHTGHGFPTYMAEKVTPRIGKMFFGVPPAPFSA